MLVCSENEEIRGSQGDWSKSLRHFSQPLWCRYGSMGLNLFQSTENTKKVTELVVLVVVLVWGPCFWWSAPDSPWVEGCSAGGDSTACFASSWFWDGRRSFIRVEKRSNIIWLIQISNTRLQKSFQCGRKHRFQYFGCLATPAPPSSDCSIFVPFSTKNCCHWPVAGSVGWTSCPHCYWARRPQSSCANQSQYRMHCAVVCRLDVADSKTVPRRPFGHHPTAGKRDHDHGQQSYSRLALGCFSQGIKTVVKLINKTWRC